MTDRERNLSAMLEKYQAIGNYDRLKELSEADKDERCVVVPCKRGDICYEVDAGHGVIKHRVTGYYTAEQEVEFSDGMHIVKGITINTLAIDDNGMEWPDHYDEEEWGNRLLTREDAETELEKVK